MGIKISELPQASQLTSDDIIPIVQSGDTKKIPVGNVISNSHNSSTAGTYSSNYINDNFNKLIPKASYNTSSNETYSCSYVNGAIPEMFNSYSTSSDDAYSCNYINGLNTYSTTEHRIGTWIDGKPVYQTTIIRTTTGDVAHQISNIDKITGIKGFFMRKDGVYETLPRIDDISGWNAYIGDVSKTTINLKLGANYTGNVGLDTAYITLEYTKTTD